PQTIGPTSCAVAVTYPNAWEPALTSLANGTLVLVYVLYNTTSMVPFLNAYAPPLSELMLTESYNGGSTWTTPLVLNSSVDPSLVGISFPQLQPSVAAYGNSVYVSWMTMALPHNPPSPGAPSSVSMLISTDGGLGWSPVISIASSPYSNYGNPNVLVNSTGTVYLAYAGSLPYSGFVYVASSTDNFTSWTSHFVGISSGETLYGPFSLVAPKLAWNAMASELYVAWTGNDYFTCGSYPAYCGSLSVPEVWNTTDAGLLWNHEFAAKTSFFTPAQLSYFTSTGAPYAYTPYQVAGVFDLAIGVTPTNTLELSGLFDNASLCFNDDCSYVQQEVVSSPNGVNWTGPFVLNGTLQTWNATAGWPGESGTVLASGSHLWFAYTQLTCPSAPTGQCNPYYPYSSPLTQSQVIVSSPFAGTGYSATFTANGINATTLWEIDLDGNIRIGVGTSSLVVSGIPGGAWVAWTIPGANNTSSFRFYVTHQSTYPAVEVSASFTDTVNFTKYVPFEVKISPPAYGNPNLQPPATLTTGQCVFYFYNGGTFVDSEFSCINMAITPWVVGVINWVPIGQNLSVNISFQNIIYRWCYQFIPTATQDLFCEVGLTNLTFLSWTGTGLGSVTTNRMNITLAPLGPVVETANVVATSSCGGYYDSYQKHVYEVPSCGNISTSLQFTEHGLPTGTDWGVSLASPSGATLSGQATGPTITFQTLAVATYYAISPWTIPTSNPNLFWVGTASVGAGIVPPTGVPIRVNFTEESLSGLSFGLLVQEQGLPTGTNWAYTVGNGATNTSYGAYGTSSSLTLPAAVDYTVTAGMVSGEAGAGYEVTGVTYFVDTINGSAVINTSLTAAFNLTGITNVTFWYSLAYYVTLIAGANGTVSPGSQWVLNATGLLIHASPSAGYIFVGWSGSGPGATGSAQRHTALTLIHPTGPVTEIATFAPRPPPEWTLTVSENGLPLAQPYTVELGANAYTGNGTFVVKNLSSSSVAVSFPDIYQMGSPGLRYTGGNPTSSLNLTGTQLQINANGTLTVSYATEFLLTVSGTAGGTVSFTYQGVTSPGGASWINSGALVNLSASPSAGHRFNGWNGTGVGSKTVATSSVKVVVGGVVTETALFTVIPPPPPATYTLTVNEQGLPTATGWSAGLGSLGGSGSNGIVFSQLNGSYTLSVPVVYGTAGIRYVPNGSTSYTAPLMVTHNGTWNVSFTEQVLLTVQVSGGGNITQGSTGWVPDHQAVSLAAAAGAGWLFAGWSGTGGGWTNQNTTSVSFTPSGPVTVTATFTPMNPPPKSTGSSTSGMPLALGLLVGLLIAGLLVGALLARRRRRSPPPPEPMESWQEAPTDSENAPVDAGAPPPGTT
ncbi:MAG TPA: hypothetical protein VGU43_00665, partial [Thermoplasmata archaeon]|nr:hypothetical protein [Thermoplasmata archaeon]